MITDYNRYKRSVVFSFFVILISWSNYLRLSGRENIRAIHIVSLLILGMAMGILVVSVVALLRSRSKE